MEKINKITPDYIKSLKERGRSSRVYQSHQLTGLRIADMLEDRGHKSLYIKLAKNCNNQKLIEVASKIAENGNIKNKGAYFMKIWYMKPEAQNIKHRTLN